MACIERRPRCGNPESPIVPEPIGEITAIIGGIWGVISGLIGVLKIFGVIVIEGGAISISGVAIGSVAVVGTVGSVLSATVAAIAVIVLVGVFVYRRCVGQDGLRECVAGVVNEIVGSFSTWSEEVFPFTAMHDRVDVVVKHLYWDIVENGQAFVHCTDEITPRRSEIMRAYYYSQEVCTAGTGAQIGVIGGAVAGIIAGAAIGAAIGCATVILCLLALIVAALVAAVAALVGALIGGQIAKAAAEDTNPTSDSGDVLTVGDYISVTGGMLRKDYDQGANVLWWEESTSFHGRASDDIPSSPFSYCDVGDELTEDSCPLSEIMM